MLKITLIFTSIKHSDSPKLLSSAIKRRTEIYGFGLVLTAAKFKLILSIIWLLIVSNTLNGWTLISNRQKMFT